METLPKDEPFVVHDSGALDPEETLAIVIWSDEGLLRIIGTDHYSKPTHWTGWAPIPPIRG